MKIFSGRSEVAGQFRLEISGGARGKIETGWFPNLITDQGLKRYLTSSGNVGYYFVVGSSGSEPSFTDTKIGSYVAITTGLLYWTPRGWDPAHEYSWSTCGLAFAKGAAAGVLAEVGLAYSSAGANSLLFSRALIRDEAGNPTTITVLSDEVLTIYYELRRKWITPPPYVIYYDDDGIEASTTVTNGAINYNDGGASRTLGGSWTPDASGLYATSFTNLTEAQGNPSISSAGPIVDSNEGAFWPAGANRVYFSPPIAKTNEFTIRFDWWVEVARWEE